jgi:hypothetical protein
VLLSAQGPRDSRLEVIHPAVLHARRSSGARSATLALGRGRITRACFLRWFPSAIPNLVVSSPTVSELYWGKKALHKIPNLAPHLGRSTHRVHAYAPAARARAPCRHELFANTKGCTEIVMGSSAVDFLINYFRGHDLIESKGLHHSRVPIVERRRNLFAVLFRLTQELL